MMIRKRIIAILILCSFILFAVLWSYKERYEGERKKSDSYSSFVDSLKSENQILDSLSDSLILVNERLGYEKILYSKKVDSFSLAVRRKDKKINELKKHENEKMRSIDSLDLNGLLKLFSRGR